MEKKEWFLPELITHEDPLGVYITFDVRKQEQAKITLFFTRDDTWAIRNMDELGQYKLTLKGSGISIKRNRGSIKSNDLCFSYPNGVGKTGTVYYNHARVKDLMDESWFKLGELEKKMNTP
ncbi:hypothetical protein AB6C73_12270 [Vibrio splendidus]